MILPFSLNRREISSLKVEQKEACIVRVERLLNKHISMGHSCFSYPNGAGDGVRDLPGITVIYFPWKAEKKLESHLREEAV